MKGFKLSKTSWLILAAGVFLVALAGLGLTRSQQIKDQTRLDDELSLTEKRLETLQTAALSQQVENLRVQVDEGKSQLEDSKARLRQTVVSVDVTDEFYKIAELYGVNVTTYGSTIISQANYEGVNLSTISVVSDVEGSKVNILNFIMGLNNGYVTGNVQSIQVTFKDTYLRDTQIGINEYEDPTTDTATVTMLIYSYEGP